MEFSRQEYWSGLPFPSPGDLPDSGIKLTSPTLADRFFTAEPLKPNFKVALYKLLIKGKIIKGHYQDSEKTMPKMKKMFATKYMIRGTSLVVQ